MDDTSALQERLNELQRKYYGARSLIEMMQKGTSINDLAKLREEKLAPIEEEIRKLKAQMDKAV